MASVQIKSDKKEIVEAMEAFKSIKESENFDDYGSLLIAMVSVYQSQQNESDLSFLNELTSEEKEDVSKALQTGVSQSELLKTGFIAQCRKVKSQAGKLEALKASIATGQDNTLTTIKGSADLRIDRAVKAVFAHNDCQSDIGNQWFITATAIQKLTNCNMPAIKSFLGEKVKETGLFKGGSHSELVNEHHTKHGLTEDTNRGRKGRSIIEEVVV